MAVVQQRAARVQATGVPGWRGHLGVPAEGNGPGTAWHALSERLSIHVLPLAILDTVREHDGEVCIALAMRHLVNIDLAVFPFLARADLDLHPYSRLEGVQVEWTS